MKEFISDRERLPMTWIEDHRHKSTTIIMANNHFAVLKEKASPNHNTKFTASSVWFK
jgi:hypothetical protein